MAIRETDGLDCRECSEAKKELWGCEKEGTAYEVLGEKYNRCPMRLVLPETWVWLKLYNHYQEGNFPADGILFKQTSRYYDMMMVIKREIDSWMAIKRKRAANRK